VESEETFDVKREGFLKIAIDDYYHS